MRKLEQENLKPYIRIVTIFLLAITLCILGFFFFVQKDVEKNVESTINENVVKQGHHFSSILELHYAYLEGIAQYLSDSEDLLAHENIELIRSVGKESELDAISIVDVDGISHYDNGTTKDVSSRRYFKEGISGKRTLSAPLSSRLDGQTKVVLGVPIIKNEQVIGVLGGSYNVTSLGEVLFDDIYEGEGAFAILTKEGTLVAGDTDSCFQELNEKEGGVFQCFQEKYGLEEVAKQVQSDFTQQNSGYVHMGSGKDSRYFAYVPLGFNNWMICYTVLAKQARESYTFITSYELILVLALGVLILWMMWAVWSMERKKQKLLMKYANTDALTNLSNKVWTETQISEWLKNKTGEMSETQVFLIMDIDYFKDINDQYGHAVGDEVLRQMGSCLKEVFGKEAIIGRIGGDEFVVFLKNMSELSGAEEKAIELLQQIKELKVSEMFSHPLTCSIGISCYPDHGKSYLELYKHADMALYETKEKGRNGYTIYRGVGLL